MKCEYCDKDLMVSRTEMTSEINTTKVYAKQTFVCTNSDCRMFAGRDLNNPLNTAKTVKTLVSE